MSISSLGISSSVLLVLLAGVYGSHQTAPSEPTPQQPEDPQETPNSSQNGDPAASSELAQAIDRSLRKGWRELELMVECQDEEQRLERLELYGNGVGIWDRQRQFRLSRDSMAGILNALRQAGFAEMAETYGWGRAGTAAEQRVQIPCRIVLTLDGVSQQVMQRRRGYRSAGLEQLARGILDRCREPALTGVTTESLTEGLRRVAAAELAPETFELILEFKPHATPEGDAPERWQLHIERSKVSTHVYQTSEGSGHRVEMVLGAADRAVAGMLADEGVEELPGNLYADHFTDLVVRVLNFRQHVQAGRFAGLTPTTHGEKQMSFDRIVSRLRELHRRVRREGVRSELTEAPDHLSPGEAFELAPEEGLSPPVPESPVLRRLVDQAMEDLAARLTVSRNQIAFVEIRQVVWPDASLGCPRRGMVYPQGTREGYRIRLRIGKREYFYHGGLGGPPFLCRNPREPLADTIDAVSGADPYR